MNRFFLINAFVLSFLISNCTSLPQKPKTIPKDDYTYLNQYMDYYIPAQMKNASIVGLGVNLVSDKEVLFSKGYGFSDKGKELPVTGDTIFRVGSVSKIVNLVIVMKLVEEGKLNLDTDIKKYLPELNLQSRFEKSNPITI
ncbi:MAG TPA: serine hydrolase domain-containing protein, partial [Leptospiraceae bacterium]|nr:serine hydrolase domain-containing protein [Leptospiraceae bacterium]